MDFIRLEDSRNTFQDFTELMSCLFSNRTGVKIILRSSSGRWASGPIMPRELGFTRMILMSKARTCQ